MSSTRPLTLVLSICLVVTGLMYSYVKGITDQVERDRSYVVESTTVKFYESEVETLTPEP